VGTATASHQVEGSNQNNNWARWESEPGRILQGQKAGLACDGWGGRWKEDLTAPAETGRTPIACPLNGAVFNPNPYLG
jgi:beta-glucosidase